MNAKKFKAVWEGTFRRVNGQYVAYTMEVDGTLDAIRTALNYFISKKRGLKFIQGKFESLTEVSDEH